MQQFDFSSDDCTQDCTQQHAEDTQHTQEHSQPEKSPDILVSRNPKNPDFFFPPDFQELFIGRNQACDIVISEPRISGKHVRLFRDNFGYYLQDLSANGTYLRGERMKKNVFRPLHPGDEFSLVINPEKAKGSGTPLIAAYVLAAGSHLIPGSICYKYDMEAALGSGNFGHVRCGRNKQTGEKVAIKMIEREKFLRFRDNRGSSLTTHSEVEMLKSLCHPNVMKFYEMYEEGGNIYLVTELLEGGDLLNYLLEYGCFEEEVTRRLFAQLCTGLQYLHDSNVVHRDIKPDNILLTEKSPNTTLKISDFGLARDVKPNERMKTFCGTPHYLAPEVIKAQSGGGEGYGKEVDLWCLGVVLYAMLSASMPFSDDNLNDQITSGNYDLDIPEFCGVSASAKELVKSLMQVDSQKRLTIEQVLEHPWIKGGLASSPPSEPPGFEQHFKSDESYRPQPSAPVSRPTRRSSPSPSPSPTAAPDTSPSLPAASPSSENEAVPEHGSPRALGGESRPLLSNGDGPTPSDAPPPTTELPAPAAARGAGEAGGSTSDAPAATEGQEVRGESCDPAKEERINPLRRGRPNDEGDGGKTAGGSSDEDGRKRQRRFGS